MASDKELLDNYLTKYNDLIRDLELFDKEFPDSNAEHNFWVDVIARLKRKMHTLGISDTEPVPERK
jgi:hypothetical protein